MGRYDHSGGARGGFLLISFIVAAAVLFFSRDSYLPQIQTAFDESFPEEQWQQIFDGFQNQALPLYATVFNEEDFDDDGLPTWLELLIFSDPNVADTDGDGKTDGEEFDNGQDPATFAKATLTDELVSQRHGMLLKDEAMIEQLGLLSRYFLYLFDLGIAEPDRVKEGLEQSYKQTTQKHENFFLDLLKTYPAADYPKQADIITELYLETFPDSIKAHEQAAYTKQVLGETEQAITFYEKALEMGSENPAIQHNLHLLLQQLEQQTGNERGE